MSGMNLGGNSVSGRERIVRLSTGKNIVSLPVCTFKDVGESRSNRNIGAGKAARIFIIPPNVTTGRRRVRRLF